MVKWVLKVEGDGSTFWFTLDLKKAVEPPPVPVTPDLAGQRILIVDDNATNRYLLDQLMVNWKVGHALANNGENALNQMRTAVKEGNPF